MGWILGCRLAVFMAVALCASGNIVAAQELPRLASIPEDEEASMCLFLGGRGPVEPGMVRLLTFDKVVLEIPREVALKSDLLKNIIEDIESLDEPIQLLHHSLKRNLVQKLIPLLQVEADPVNLAVNLAKAISRTFTADMLPKLVEAGNYLDAPNITNAAALALFNRLDQLGPPIDSLVRTFALQAGYNQFIQHPVVAQFIPEVTRRVAAVCVHQIDDLPCLQARWRAMRDVVVEAVIAVPQGPAELLRFNATNNINLRSADPLTTSRFALEAYDVVRSGGFMPAGGWRRIRLGTNIMEIPIYYPPGLNRAQVRAIFRDGVLRLHPDKRAGQILSIVGGAGGGGERYAPYLVQLLKDQRDLALQQLDAGAATIGLIYQPAQYIP